MSSMDSMRLRELIRSVRQCKTTSDEVELINMESAKIREGFKEGTPYMRTRNMLKLLYIRMLGYPSEFGQLEVINLLSQDDFCGKRIGYLALQLLLDESDEVLTLAENRMKTDLNSTALLTQAVALNAAANIASEDMARDIFDDIMRLFEANTPTSYIKNKLYLAALRIVKKVPDHAEYFLGKMHTVFSENVDSTLYNGLTLVNACLLTESAGAFIGTYRRLATTAVRALKSLVLASRVSDYDVGNVSNPHLQCKLLTFMRIIGKGSSVTSEALNDVLAQVITNTDTNTNAGCAVLYECVTTISAIESDEGLRTLAINTISRFLSSTRDNNLRFVALQTLLVFVKFDFAAVQQQHAVVLDCLKDPDISIRRRALDLTVELITEENVRLLVPDLIAYLGLCPEEMKAEVTRHLCHVIETHAPNEEWQVDMSLKVLRSGKQYAPEDFAIRLVGVISNQPTEVRVRAVCFIWSECYYSFDAFHQLRKAFLIAALWCLGEYPELLSRSVSDAPMDLIVESVTEITTNSIHTVIKQYGLTALMKIACRFPEQREKILSTFSTFVSSLDCELQQRSSEYTVLLKQFQHEAVLSFAPMPPLQVNPPEDEVKPVQVLTTSNDTLKRETANVLDDLFDFGGGGAGAGGSPSATAASATAAGGRAEAEGQQSQPAAVAGSVNARSNDALSDLFGGGEAGTSGRLASNAFPASAPSAAVGPLINDPFGPSPITDQERRLARGTCVYQCNELSAWLSAVQEEFIISTQVMIVSHIDKPLENIVFQAAVPKSATLTPSPLHSTRIEPNSQLTQMLRVDNTNHDPPNQLLLLVKLSCTIDGQAKEYTFRVSEKL